MSDGVSTAVIKAMFCSPRLAKACPPYLIFVLILILSFVILLFILFFWEFPDGWGLFVPLTSHCGAFRWPFPLVFRFVSFWYFIRPSRRVDIVKITF